MKKRAVIISLSVILLAVIAAAAVFFTVDSGKDKTGIFVSVDGKDTNAGTYSSPFATIERALEAVAELESEEPIVIKLRGGTYKLTETVDIGEEYSNVTIQAYENEEVIITGNGNEIPYSAFKTVTDEEFLSKLSEQDARGKVVYVDLKELGITEYGTIKMNGFSLPAEGYMPTLSLNNDPLTLARYPNEGYIYTKKIVWTDDNYEKSIKYTLYDERWRNWDTDNDEIWTLAYFAFDWAESIVRAEFDRENGTVTGLTRYEALADRRLYYFNIPEEIDMPGEYYIDRNTGLLYMIPPEEISDSDTFLFSTSEITLFNIHDTENITIDGVQLTGTEAAAVNVQSCTNVVIDNCEIYLSGGDATAQFTDCYSSGVSNSYLHDLLGGGIGITACGDKQNLVSGDCFVYNTEIADFGIYKKSYAYAITLTDDVGTNISHCEIYNGPHRAIDYTSNDLTIEYCDIHDMCRETADSGAIYTYRRFDARGNIIRYNYIHDLRTIDNPTGMYVYGVCLDGMHSGTSVYGNIFYNLDFAAVFAGGRDNEFSNNIIISCTNSLQALSTGMMWLEMGDPTLEKNLKEMVEALEQYDYKHGIWAEKYPELVNILDDEPAIPKNFKAVNNVYVLSPSMEIDDYIEQYSLALSGNISLVNPYVVFADFFMNHDWTIVDTSELLKKSPDFELIDFSQIGLIKENDNENQTATPTEE